MKLKRVVNLLLCGLLTVTTFVEVSTIAYATEQENVEIERAQLEEAGMIVPDITEEPLPEEVEVETSDEDGETAQIDDLVVGVQSTNGELPKEEKQEIVARESRQTRVVGDVAIDTTNFPDDYFREKVKEYDINNDEVLSQVEIDAVTQMGQYGMPTDIEDLKGIEFFRNLTVLEIPYPRITNLDVSKNVKLTSLAVMNSADEWGRGFLTQLDVSKNINLTALLCTSNLLTRLDVSQNTKLEYLECSGNNLTELDLSKNTNLTDLGCGYNNLTKLDLSKNTKLENLYYSENKLNSLDLSKLVNLKYLGCMSNGLTVLEISKNTKLENVECSNNKLSSLDTSKLANLESLYCKSNNLTKLDLKNNTNLLYVDCSDNQLIELTNWKNLKKLKTRRRPSYDETYITDNYLTEEEIKNGLPVHLLEETEWLDKQIKNQKAGKPPKPTATPRPTTTPKPTVTPVPKPTVVAKPVAATGVTANASAAKAATISWKRVSGATGYEILRSNKKSSGFKSIKSLGASATSFKDTSVVEGKTYYYKIRSKNSTGFKDSGVMTVKTIAKTTSLKAGKAGNNLKVSYKSSEKNFQIQVSTKKNAGYKNVATNNKKKSLTVKNSSIKKALKLKKGKSYNLYVRTRSFRVVNNKKVYGSWTTTKVVKNFKIK